MGRLTRWFVLAGVVMSTTACYTALKPGRCDHTSDCASGFYCNLDPAPGADGTCMPISTVDGGDAVGDGAVESTTPDGASEVNDAQPDADAGPGDVGGEVRPQCTKDQDCSGTTPVCGPLGTCRSCNDLAANFCASRSATPACGPSGACVACATSADCSKEATKPICDLASNTCVACTSDDQCFAKLGANPGVCMSHQDGRCATDAETIYVQKSSTCTNGSQGGAAAMPFCSLEPVLIVLSGSRALVVVRGSVTTASWTLQGVPTEVSIIGQQMGAVGAGASPALHVSGGQAYLRGIEMTSALDIGVVADSSSVLRLDSVLVDNSKGGGILLDASSFSIVNTTVTGNGPGTLGLATWGGIAVQNRPTAGPATLTRVSVTNNKQVGLSCSSAISGMGVLASGNAGGVEISPTCTVTACSPAGATCGSTLP
jgi:hypothetical protein